MIGGVECREEVNTPIREFSSIGIRGILLEMRVRMIGGKGNRLDIMKY